MEEIECCEVEKNLIEYIGEKDRLINEIKMLVQEIKTNILECYQKLKML